MRWRRRAVALAVVLCACSGARRGAEQVGVDRDGDGWKRSDGDCDDRDRTIHPNAVDLPRDGVDQDCDGADASALPAAALTAGDLVITEVMMDPVGVPGELGEWFELYNSLDEPVDLEGLVISDDGYDDFFVGERTLVEAGAYAVLGARTDPEINGGAPVVFQYQSGFGLQNDDDVIRVSVPDGWVIDAVHWSSGYPLADGRSLALDPTASAADNDGPDVWCLGASVYGVGGYGTPGAPNPSCPPRFAGPSAVSLDVGDLVISEIMQNPSAVDEDFGEWLEITNTRDEAVSLRGLTIRVDGDDVSVEEDVVVAAGGQVVVGGWLDPEVNGGAEVAWAWRWGLALPNSGASVALAAGTRTLDVVAYDNGNSFPDPTGASMSLDPSAHDADANDDGGNWCAAATPYGAGDLGSPGAANPDCP